MKDKKKSDFFNTDEVDKIIERIGGYKRNVIPILQEIQKLYNFIPEPAMKRICEKTEISEASVTGVATFYSQFRLKPAGRHSVKVCIGTACHVMGAEEIFNSFKEHLKIPDNEDTDAERLFTVEKVACLGCCMLAPAVQIDDLTYGFLTPDKVKGVIKDFLSYEAGDSADFSEEGKESVTGSMHICLCSSCRASGSEDIYLKAVKIKQKYKLPLDIKDVSCLGMSCMTPLVEIRRGDRVFYYGRVTEVSIENILLHHFKPGGLVKKTGAVLDSFINKLLSDEYSVPHTRFLLDRERGELREYMGSQKNIVTENCGTGEPLDIDFYIENSGFKGLEKALAMKEEGIIDLITESGLRGRGGGGFSTGRKWRMVHRESVPVKYIICNGDEGDPGAFMDRMILESHPFRVIEGMITAAFTIKAEQGFAYVRAEYPVALQRLEEALEICRERGFLGKNILNSGWNFDIETVAGAGAFVCGEETALIAAIEGRRGMPSHRAPYPSERGLWNKPTLVNNVETYANIPWILREGYEAFIETGTELSRGTKAFALAGKVRRSGLVEVPMGRTLREIVFDIGGGIPEGRKLKAVQVGGPSGGCVPASMIDTPVDYDALAGAGTMMGSGGLVVLDENDCMVDIARYFMSFTQKESCGKCTFCRVGTKRMLEILDRLCEGRGREGDIERLEELGQTIKQGSLCGLGKSAPNPVLSTIKYFRDEYEAHIDGRCPAGKCRELITYRINENCIGCTLCARACPVGAIEFDPLNKHEIDEDECIRCGSCYSACTEAAVEVF